jgi:starvation-inducible DNA-binding protein
MFGHLHRQLDDLVDAWRELADTVAERAVAIGFVPDGQAHVITAATQLSPVAQGVIEDQVVVRELTRRVADVAERVRSRVEYIGQADLVSQDVLIDVVSVLEKQQWMLRAQLPERG